jgi:cyclopropane fatty-acyl-phospholipid synthase-like methyltransferase
MSKPFSQACENNKQPILEVLKTAFADTQSVLEIGSGTGQHGVFFAPNLPHLSWQTSDMPENHPGINAWIDELPAPNLKRPVPLTIGEDNWPDSGFDGVFTANTTHIMQVSEARAMMQLVADNLPSGGVLCQYGPFNVDGQYTSDSNRAFDQHLLAQGCGGIRDITELQSWVEGRGLVLVQRHQMPANNQLLEWRKR